jgi:hypothetical protein
MFEDELPRLRREEYIARINRVLDFCVPVKPL